MGRTPNHTFPCSKSAPIHHEPLTSASGIPIQKQLAMTASPVTSGGTLNRGPNEVVQKLRNTGVDYIMM